MSFIPTSLIRAIHGQPSGPLSQDLKNSFTAACPARSSFINGADLAGTLNNNLKSRVAFAFISSGHFFTVVFDWGCQTAYIFNREWEAQSSLTVHQKYDKWTEWNGPTLLCKIADLMDWPISSGKGSNVTVAALTWFGVSMVTQLFSF